MSASPARFEAVEFSVFSPTRPDYADFSVDPATSFDWFRIFDELGIPAGQNHALFVFRSIKRAAVNERVVAALDERALLAAQEGGKLIHYEANEGGSWCLWPDAETARVAGTTEAHQAAVRYAPRIYLEALLNQYNIGRTATNGPVELTLVNSLHLGWTHLQAA